MAMMLAMSDPAVVIFMPCGCLLMTRCLYVWVILVVMDSSWLSLVGLRTWGELTGLVLYEFMFYFGC